MNMQSVATLASGCFWCMDTIFRQVKGIDSVVTGYSGGNLENPTATQVYGGDSGHAEAYQVTFDPEIISYREILEIFYALHDPTKLNQQDYDVGEEYRSAIFYHNDEQKKIAEEVTTTYAASLWDDPVVTQIVPFQHFWPAEDYNQDFYTKNPGVGYCQIIINPKLEKFRKNFASKLKSSI